MNNTQISKMLAYIQEANNLLSWAEKLADMPAPIETATEYGTIVPDENLKSSRIL
jgi:hypothetical protein